MADHIVIVIVGSVVGVLQGVIIMMLKGQNQKLSQICQDNTRDHRDMWRRINHHSHAANGKVIVEES